MGTESEGFNNKNRIWPFDFFRAYGCLAIILLHVISGWRDDPNYSIGFYSAGSLRMLFDNAIVPLLVRMAVPFFFMMSGALFLNPDREVTNDSIGRHIKKILINLGIFGYFMAIIELVVATRSFEPIYLYFAILNLVQEETWSHLWYLYATIGLYLITPILRAWIGTISKREFDISIIIAVFLFSIIPTINDLFAIKITQFGLTTTRGALLWYLLGYYLMYVHKEYISQKKGVLYLMIITGGVMTAVFGALSYKMEITLIQPYHIWIVMYSSVLYMLLLQNKQVEKISKKGFVTALSSYSLAIYIIHPVFLNALYKGVHIYPDRLPPIVGELLIWVFIVAVSLIGAIIISKLPVFRRYVL